MRREELEAAVARHAERVREEGGTPRSGPTRLPATSPAERKAKRDDAESRAARAANDRAMTKQEQRLLDRRLGDVDSAARAAWSQMSYLADDMDTDARAVIGASIHAARAAEVARTGRSDDTRRAADRARDRL
ncbi:MAG: hypothetical protein INR72_14455, partial [Williamsia herbipolensis]|nr:hypothetical protein [Williamsia herbipolensis]